MVSPRLPILTALSLHLHINYEERQDIFVLKPKFWDLLEFDQGGPCRLTRYLYRRDRPLNRPQQTLSGTYIACPGRRRIMKTPSGDLSSSGCKILCRLPDPHPPSSSPSPTLSRLANENIFAPRFPKLPVNLLVASSRIARPERTATPSRKNLPNRNCTFEGPLPGKSAHLPTPFVYRGGRGGELCCSFSESIRGGGRRHNLFQFNCFRLGFRTFLDKYVPHFETTALPRFWVSQSLTPREPFHGVRSQGEGAMI